MKKMQNKKNYTFRSLINGLQALFVVIVACFVFNAQTATVYAADSDANYLSFSKVLGSCPRKGQPARDECILKVAKSYVDAYCANKNKATCAEEWRTGYLVWFSQRSNQEALQNSTGETAIDTSNPACSDKTGSQPAVCTQPFNTPDCKDRAGARPSYCDIPALSTDGTNVDDTPNRTVTGDRAAFESCNDVDNCDFIDKFVNPAIKFLSAGVGLIVTIMIIVAGIQYSSAGSDPQKVVAAKGKIANAIIALVTYIFSFGLLQWLWPGGIL